MSYVKKSSMEPDLLEVGTRVIFEDAIDAIVIKVEVRTIEVPDNGPLYLDHLITIRCSNGQIERLVDWASKLRVTARVH
jgi:hypothetical protein